MRRVLGVAAVLVVVQASIAAQSASTLLVGGTAEDTARDIIADAAGNVYVAGGVASPVYGATQGMAAYVAKYSPAGALLCSRLIDGPNYDRAYAIELTPEGDVVIGGRAGAGLPTTAGAAQVAFGGDTTPDALYGLQDGFVARLGADCAVQWVTYLGGSDEAVVRDVAVTADGIYAVFTATGANVWFVPLGALYPSRQGDDGVIARLSADGSTVLNASYVGGSGNDGGVPTVRADATGVYAVFGMPSTNAPVSPGAAQPAFGGGARDVFVIKLSTDLSQRIYGTYLGGNNAEGMETHHLGLLPDGSLVVSVYTQSTNWPVTAGAVRSTNSGGTDFGICVITPTGTAFSACSYLGSSGTDAPEGVAVLPDGRIVVGGHAPSGWPTTADRVQGYGGGSFDGVVAVLSADLTTLAYSTFIGGSGSDTLGALAVAPDGRVLYAGYTTGSLPGTSGYSGGAYDAFFGWLTLPSPSPCVLDPLALTVLVTGSHPIVSWAGIVTGTDDRGCSVSEAH